MSLMLLPDKVFSGNPAAVCIMDEWLPDDLMLKIAMENQSFRDGLCR